MQHFEFEVVSVPQRSYSFCFCYETMELSICLYGFKTAAPVHAVFLLSIWPSRGNARAKALVCSTIALYRCRDQDRTRLKN